LEINKRSKNILNFRPKINFVEPDQQDSPIEPQLEEATPLQIEEKRVQVKNLADSVNKLAQAVQFKIDNKSKDQIVILDSGVDNAVIRSLRRSYPDANNFDRITYAQYKKCRDRLRDYAAGVSLRAAINQEEINSAKSQMDQGKYTVGGIGTEAATNGGLRPELDDKNRLIDPVDIEQFQEDLLIMLFNMLWDTFIKPILKALPFIGGDVESTASGFLGKPSKAMEQMVADIKERIKLTGQASRERREQIESGDIPPPRPTTSKGPQAGLPDLGNPVQFQDCNLIVKTYERGCHASMTEASVFAPFTGQLDFIRNMSSTISNQMDSYTAIDPLKSEAPKNEDHSLGAFLDKLLPDSMNLQLEGSVDFGLDSECIPCGLRINFSEELNVKAAITDIGAYMLEVMTAWLYRALSQIRNLIDMFKNLDKYIDICTFLDFLKDFVCIPDLAKILAILAALMMDLSFELNAIIDLALSLIVPLFMPFLTNLLDSLMKYVLLIIKPIECIIDSIQNMLGKLDYNVLFQNIPPPINLTAPTATVSTQIRVPGARGVPILGSLIPDPVDTPIQGESPIPGITIDLAPAQRAIREREQATVDKAYENLQKLRKAAASVDASDPAAYERYKEQETKAREEYQDAVKERDLSEIGEANLALERFQTQMKGTFLELITLLREAVLKFDAWVNSLFEEFKKMLNEYVGGTGIYFNFGVKKLAIIQMIAFVNAVIKLIGEGPNCDDEEKEVEFYVNSIAKESGFKVFTDDDGNVFIEENIDEMDDIADALNIQGPSSLINYTGDEVLDATLADTVKKLTIPNQLKIKCSLISSVADQEKVNQWISELDSE
jgi:hypothetical protein